ncbi:substrate-binding domain-containing protein [Qaidamihabitans albus]|uniref:substrate-binding domain-containing protein n=1 Tax=Qaidamihabitans albus TaxID=2795733 RepID=UPI0018F10BDD|nr:substrate-binding domain-containing protein [Qaidamihabitans albus]
MAAQETLGHRGLGAFLPSVTGEELLSRAAGGPSGSVRAALVTPSSGPLGLMGPASLNCALLACSEVNARGGILGRPLDLVRVDGGRAPREVAREVDWLVRAGEVDAVVGMHTSAARVAIADAVAGLVPYVYTPPYEGGEQRLGLLCTGETLGRQLGPALAWLVEHRRARRWFLLGSDYRWPRAVHALAGRMLHQLGSTVVGEELLPLGASDFDRPLTRLVSRRADALLLNLIGDDLVRFHRAACGAGLARRVLRLSACLEENTLLGLGGDDSGELWTTMGFFPTLATDASLAFDARYAAAFGPHAPVTSAHAESCYEGVGVLAAVAARAGSLHPAAFDAAAEGACADGARGRVYIANRHVPQTAYLAHADGLDFRVVAGFGAPAA